MELIGVGSSEGDNLVKHHSPSSCYAVQEYMDGGTLKQKIWNQVKTGCSDSMLSGLLAQ